ncbi:MAG: CHASE2 domain-containing protein [Bacteroidota bacterium]|nr:CHASE2 domain-containing protein [Bacteroidota bacterium]
MKNCKNELMTFFIRPLLIALIVCGILLLFNINPLDPSASSSRKVATSNTVDTYFAIANEPGTLPVEVDSNIVLIKADACSRGDIARLLTQVAKANPRVVGLDVVFPEPKQQTEDEALVNSLKKLKNQLVVSCVLGDEDEKTHFLNARQGNFFEGRLPDVACGCINLMESKTHMVNEFTPFFKLNDKASFPSFDLQIARMADPAAIESFLRKRKAPSFINFRSLDFDTLEPDEAVRHPEMLYHKIVLIGSLNEPADMHATPVDGKMNGLVIHAYTISTILSGRSISAMSDVGRWVLTVFILIVFLDIIELVGRKLKKGMRLFIALCVLLSVWFFTIIGYIIFIRFDYVINFSPVRLAVAMAPVFADAFAALETTIKQFKKKGR